MSDLSHARGIVDQMISLGLVDGMLSVEIPQESKTSSRRGFFKRVAGTDYNSYSDSMKERIEQTREELLQKYMDDAHTFISQNWGAIDRVAQALLVKTSLRAHDIEKLIRQENSPSIDAMPD